jgi:predicted NBD/HSP70 family sugar kinase
MALAGPVDHRHRALHRSAILAGWLDLDAAAELERRINFPVHLDNDSNLGALAEATLGACRGIRHAAYVSLSSGIGAGLIVDGSLYRGHRGTAGEIGHVLIDPAGMICRCGNRGCLETLASSGAIVGLISASRGGELSMSDVLELARAGDPGARRAIGDAGRAVGSALAGLVNAFNPEMVVVGGNLSEAGDVLLGPLRASLERSALPVATQELTVCVGALGERANLLGAIALVTSQSRHVLAARIAGAVALV